MKEIRTNRPTTEISWRNHGVPTVL